jgi:2-polyprenyl-3-methyl-5-hydroxy-6-metoxy-1,4-benzoquinol methylase
VLLRRRDQPLVRLPHPDPLAIAGHPARLFGCRVIARRGYLNAVTNLDALRRPDVYPRSAAYDPQWMVDRCMGPNPLWLLEDLLGDCRLRAGMSVLDLGCGMGMTSVFLAREYGVRVQAADHWIQPEGNASRFLAAGVDGQVTAVAAEAHDLPFDDVVRGLR